VTEALLEVSPGGGVHPSSGATAAMSLVRAYQLLRANRPSPCRFVPSCSDYALESLQRHGLGRGTWLAVRRLCRCRPLGRYGADPVPD
jgi:putative membrane protein insertion efficiency factor